MKRKIAVINRTRVRTGFVAGVLSLSLLALAPAVDAATIETGFSPEGTALQLVLKTLDSAQQEIRLMGYSFTSPEGGSLTHRGETTWGGCPRGAGPEGK